MDEAARLATLRSKFVLDTAPDDTLDALVDMCAEMFDVPVALVSLVDERRQWFKARKNFDGTQTGRAGSFCAWTALCIERKVLVVRDATVDGDARRRRTKDEDDDARDDDDDDDDARGRGR